MRPLAPAVADAIERQNACYAPSAARERNLALLRGGAAAIVTGQQVGLFLGPLYNLYKAATAIRVAREIESSAGVPVVPVFWLQNEDHDLPEIACCRAPCANGETLSLSLPASADDRVSLAHLRLPAEIDALLTRLGDELGNLPHGAAALSLLRRHYRAGAGWSDAFAGALAELFAPDGLVLVDPRCDELAGLAAPIHARALERAAPIAAALGARANELAAAGFAVPVHVREGAPLSFFHPAGASGPRYRLEPADGGWREVGGAAVHRCADVVTALAGDPLVCSSSALLRPIVQDTLLPTAAYVGGLGEVAYFAQIAPLYDEYELPMPLVVPRAAFRLIEEKTRRLLARLGAEPGQAMLPDAELLAAAAPGLADEAGRLRARLTGAFTAALDASRGEIESAGPGLVRAIEKARGSVEHAVERLVAKYESARLQDERDLVEAVAQIKLLLQPEGIPQERYYGLPYFAARYGQRPFLERILDAVSPFDPAVRDLHLRDEGAA